MSSLTAPIPPNLGPACRAGNTELGTVQWLGHVATEQRRIVAGERPYVPSDVLDREAAQTDALATAGRRMPPWPDTIEGLSRLAERFPLLGLSNASRTTLLRMNACAGLRWHQALSAEEVRSYKPDPAVYELAVKVSGVPPERLLMVAAHAWDLRGAQSVGLRTAYVARPIGDGSLRFPCRRPLRSGRSARKTRDLIRTVGASR